MSTYLPPHISKEAQAFLKNFPPFEEAPPLQSDDFAGWEAMRNALHTVWQSFHPTPSPMIKSCIIFIQAHIV